ncbi:39S ribosomal protein L38, mitochondrial [Nymphon striatum]|nr:39S ribosomal protein L38, mitochondrial [Nymphon striatum]
MRPLPEEPAYLRQSKTLEHYFEEQGKVTDISKEQVDIGLPFQLSEYAKKLKKDLANIIKSNKANADLEQLAAKRELKVPLNQVYNDWKLFNGPLQIKSIAEHYGIFKDLFQHGYFIPSVVMDIDYQNENGDLNPVYRGNIIYPSLATSSPKVKFDVQPDTLWTLILTSLDSHLTSSTDEYLHWMVGNIPNGNVDEGETICDYLQPFPAKGTGYHRMVFVLYKQDSKIEYSSFKKDSPCLCLAERTFNTFKYYGKMQNFLTPAGLSFYQTTWEESLTDFFHNKLGMKEPIFEYQHPVHVFNPQVRDPHKKPFNFYLDHYRDPKEINKEILTKRLKTLDPFTPEPPAPKYPDIHQFRGNIPSWKKEELRKERRRIGKYSHL